MVKSFIEIKFEICSIYKAQNLQNSSVNAYCVTIVAELFGNMLQT